MAADEDLDRRIQALPQELQDDILDHVLFIKPGEVTIDTASYTPPWQLQFNRATRDKVAKHYYATSVFKLQDLCKSSYSVATFWLRSLPEEHRAEISDVRADYRSGAGPKRLPNIHAPPRPTMLMHEANERDFALGELEQMKNCSRHGYKISLAAGVLKANYFVVVECMAGRVDGVRTCGGKLCGDCKVQERWISDQGQHWCMVQAGRLHR